MWVLELVFSSTFWSTLWYDYWWLIIVIIAGIALLSAFIIFRRREKMWRNRAALRTYHKRHKGEY